MMTTWVALHRLPIQGTNSGRCETVSRADVAMYRHEVATDQSSVAIALGERLCEHVLLEGIFVHSAGDYAQLLVDLTGLREPTFVSAMNQAAARLGLVHTHYVDVTGISPGDVSTAFDQGTLAVDLVSSEPVVAKIVTFAQVDLPVAGVVGSYTPFIGRAGVVGVKSGYTPAAGGCDVMETDFPLGRSEVTTYVVVLSQQSTNPLGAAGDAALALTRSVRASFARVRTPSGVVVEWIGPPGDVVTSPAT